VKRQHQLKQPLEQGEHQTSTSFAELSETIRQGEVELGIAVAPQSSLKKWRERLENLDDERIKRFEVLQECGRNICLREMNLVINMFSPSKSMVLDFPKCRRWVFLGIRCWAVVKLSRLGEIKT